ncbi:probable transcription regulator [hydrothermal vent metagenome]|uniref:Probable transcription regulator n=1 Tax=hydrothermal vent metagenome TaxID=652676 RepID=A0A3B0U8Y1_9ZZZZ
MAAKDKSRASIHDVASRAGVSAATVSKVLRGTKTVKPANVEKVRMAVKELDYRMDPLASSLRRARRQIIGFVLPELESEFFGTLTSHLEILAEQAGYSLVIGSSHESEDRERQLIERMHDWRVAGTILAPVRSERGQGAAVMKNRAMVGVLVDRVVANNNFDTVTADNAHASAKVARSLIKAGHRHVLLLGLSDVSKNIRTRISAFKEQVEKSCPEMSVDVLLAGGPMYDLRILLGDYLERNRPSAVFSLFQKGTMTVLSEFRRRSINCPEDISLVGFDDAEWMQATYPSITVVAQPIAQIAHQAFARLLSRIEGHAGYPVCQLEPCDFQMRESLANIGAMQLSHTPNKRRGGSPPQ